MFHRPAFRQVARRARSFIGAALIVIQPVIAGLALVPQAAHADVASGDIVFEQFQPLTGHSGSYIRKIMKRASDGTQTMISHSSDCEGTYYNVCEDIMPNVSPDGSKVAFVGSRPAGDAPNPATDVEPVLLGVMNSDGSGQTLLHTPQYYFTDPAYPNEYTYQEDLYPSWSPNGRQIAYERDIHDKSYIYKINADGTGDTRLVTGVASFNGTASFPTWSPDGTKIAYSLLDSSNGGTQLYVMNADGTNQHLITGAPSSYLEGMPVSGW